MFNLGLSEIFVIAAIALIVIGPKQLPEVARNIARFINEIKRTTADFRKNFTEIDDLKDAAKQVTSVVRDTEGWVRKKAEDLLEDEKEKKPLQTGHQDNPNHDIVGEEKTNNQAASKKEQPQHEGFAQRKKKEDS